MKARKLINRVLLVALIIGLGMPRPSLRAAEPAPAPSKGPSVLLLVEGWGRLDFNVLKAFHARGFQVDYAERKAWSKEIETGEFPKRLAKYNVVVLVQPCESQGGTNLDALLKMLADYARDGGGLLLMPNTVTWDIPADYLKFAEKSREYFGAAYLLDQWIDEKDPQNAADNSRALGFSIPGHYAWTANVAAHPVTQGVEGIWYLTDTYRNERCTAIPLDPTDPAWTVVLRASLTARSVPYAEVAQERHLLISDKGRPGSKKRYDSAPPLMAVRELGQGRVAYLTLDDLVIWCNGYRHLNGGNEQDNSPGYSLGGTLKERTSGLERLIANTLSWLGEPARKSGAPGGYTQDLTRLDLPPPPVYPALDWRELKPANASIEEVKKLAAYHGMRDQWQFWYDEVAQINVKPHQGLIGARSTYSDGKASATEMIKAARAAGLNFLVFLERFDLMTAEKCAALKKECAAASDDEFIALPGYAVDSDCNQSLFIFGPNVVWPDKKNLTADGKKLDMLAELGVDVSGLGQMNGFTIARIIQLGSQMGYYHFTAAAPPGQIRAPMYDLRLYSAIGLYYYDAGRLVEGPDQNWEAFKDVNDLHLCIVPYVIDMVYDPAQLNEAAASHVLTRVLAGAKGLPTVKGSYRWPAGNGRAPDSAKDIATVLSYGATGRGRESSVSVAPAAGPVIRLWTCQNRDYSSSPLQQWVTPNYRWRVDCIVTSEIGLDTLEIWDGVDLFRRIKLAGAKSFVRHFDLSHDQMRQLLIKATDAQGHTVYSANVQNGNHTAQDYFCGDRINGSLFHGPTRQTYLTFGLQPGRSYGADGLDGFAGASAAPMNIMPGARRDLGFKETKVTDDVWGGTGYGAAHCYDYLIAEDGWIQSTTSDYSYPLGVWSVHGWFTYGPLIEREFTGPVGWRSERSGDLQTYESFLTFKKSGTIQSFPGDFIDSRHMGLFPGNGTVFACAAGPRDPVYVFNYPEQKEAIERLADSDFRIGKGGFVACCGTVPGSGACNLFVLDDYKRRLVKPGPTPYPNIVALESLPAGTPYQAGERLTAKVLQVLTPSLGAIGPNWYQRVADYLGLDGQPDIKLTLKAGVALPVTEGFCDIDIAATGYADLTFAPDDQAPIQKLGVRLKNGCSRWTAMQYQPKLPMIKSIQTWNNRLALEIKREVPDGLKPTANYHDLVYVAAALPRGDDPPRQILAGHPVVASDRRVFISVTALSWKPYTYAVEVNNPTDETLAVTFKPGLPLPNLPFPEQTVTLQPGELKELFRNGE